MKRMEKDDSPKSSASNTFLFLFLRPSPPLPSSSLLSSSLDNELPPA